MLLFRLLTSGLAVSALHSNPSNIGPPNGYAFVTTKDAQNTTVFVTTKDSSGNIVQILTRTSV